MTLTTGAQDAEGALVSKLEVRCFGVEPLPFAQRTLRRYQGLYQGTTCGPARRHEVNLVVDTVAHPLDVHRRVFAMGPLEGLDPQPTWPPRCSNPACPVEGGYVFAPSDPGAVMLFRLGRRMDTDERVLFYDPPVGGVLDMTAHVPDPRHRGHDALSLVVKVPGGLWYIDAPHAILGGRWTRSGSLDAITTLNVTQTEGTPYRWTIVDGVLRDQLSSSGVPALGQRGEGSSS